MSGWKPFKPSVPKASHPTASSRVPGVFMSRHMLTQSHGGHRVSILKNACSAPPGTSPFSHAAFFQQRTVSQPQARPLKHLALPPRHLLPATHRFVAASQAPEAPGLCPHAAFLQQRTVSQPQARPLKHLALPPCRLLPATHRLAAASQAPETPGFAFTPSSSRNSPSRCTRKGAPGHLSSFTPLSSKNSPSRCGTFGGTCRKA